MPCLHIMRPLPSHTSQNGDSSERTSEGEIAPEQTEKSGFAAAQVWGLAKNTDRQISKQTHLALPYRHTSMCRYGKFYFSRGGAVVIFTQYPDMMTIADLRSALGIGRTKAYELVSSGEIRSFRVGKTIRIPKASVLDYVVEKSYNMGETGRRSYHEGGNSS